MHPRAESEGSTCDEPHQPTVIDDENVRAVIFKPSTSTGPGETTEKGHAGATHEVHTRTTTCIADAYWSHQAPGPGGIQPVPTVLCNIQDVHMDSIPGPEKTAVNAFGLVDTAMTQLDSTNTGYRSHEAHKELKLSENPPNQCMRVGQRSAKMLSQKAVHVWNLQEPSKSGGINYINAFICTKNSNMGPLTTGSKVGTCTAQGQLNNIAKQKRRLLLIPD